MARIRSDAVASSLASHLNRVMPEGIAITEETGSVGPVHRGQYWGGTNVVRIIDQDASFDQNVVTASEALLDAIQDGIVRITGVRWPSRGHGSRPGEGELLPSPGAAIEGDKLHLWFGDRERPELTIEPIDLEE